MNKRWSLLLFLGFLTLAGLVTAEESITFQLLRGRAALSRNGGSTWLDLGPEPINVKVQDMLRTEGETRGELRFPDGSLFRVKSNSQVTLLTDGLQMQVGESWFNLKKQGRAFQVITPTTVCGVLGTTFDVAVDRYGRTQVRVFEGLVSVKARDDQRRRQLVLQRGMQTSIRERGITGDQTQKFDARALETDLNREWDRKAAPAPKSGLERPGLPPIRPSLPDGIKHLNQNQRPGLQPEGKAPDGRTSPPDVRDRMNFFENLRAQRLRERGTREILTQKDRQAQGRQPYPGRPFGHDGKPTSPDLMREGHGRPFGQATPAPSGIQDERMLREEILKVQNDLVRIQESLAQIEAELRSLQERAADLEKKSISRQRAANLERSKVRGQMTQNPDSPPSSAPSTENLSLSQIRERIQKLQTTRATLREQQQKLRLRLQDLRNRLR